MLVLVSYDVETKTGDGRKRLHKIAKVCENYGVRVQNSVFEVPVDPAQWVAFRQKLFDLYDEEKDSLRFYFMGSNAAAKVEHYGAKKTLNLEEDPLLF